MEDTQVILQPFVRDNKIFREDDYGEQFEVQLPFATWFEAVDHLNGRGYGNEQFAEHGVVLRDSLQSETHDAHYFAVLVEFKTVADFVAVSKRHQVCLELPVEANG